MILKTSNVSAKNFFLNASKKTSILDDRKSLLLNIAEAIANEYSKNEIVRLNFICTHNSRRSQLGQVWSFYGAHHFNLNIHAFSGGTEVTAFHRNTVKIAADPHDIFALGIGGRVKLSKRVSLNSEYFYAFDESKSINATVTNPFSKTALLIFSLFSSLITVFKNWNS